MKEEKRKKRQPHAVLQDGDSKPRRQFCAKINL